MIQARAINRYNGWNIVQDKIFTCNIIPPNYLLITKEERWIFGDRWNLGCTIMGQTAMSQITYV